MEETKPITNEFVKRWVDEWNCPYSIKEDVALMVYSLIDLKGIWAIYKDLFDFNDKRIDLLNDSCPLFFGGYQFIAAHFALSQLAKFAEGEKSHGSLASIHKRALQENISEAKKEVLKVSKTKFYKECKRKELLRYRNNFLAHIGAGYLEDINKHKVLSKIVSKSITSLNAYLNFLAGAFSGKDMGYGFRSGYEGIGGAISHILMQSERYSTLLKEKKVCWSHKESSPFYQAACDPEVQKEIDLKRGRELANLTLELERMAAENIKHGEANK